MPLMRSRLLPKLPWKALSFDGIDDYVEVPHSDVLNVQPGNRITIEVLAYLEGWDPDYPVGVLIDKRTEDYANYNWEFTGSWIEMRIHAQGGKYAVRIPHSLNRWNHYVMVLNGSWLGAYLNANLMKEKNDVPPTTGNDEPLIICRAIYRGYYVRGIIAFVRIYSRPLTDKEIEWNYYHPDDPIRSGLVLWLHYDSIDEANGIWKDKTIYGNNGAIYGATAVEFTKPPIRRLSPTRILSPVR